jgi:hypothetical protein
MIRVLIITLPLSISDRCMCEPMGDKVELETIAFEGMQGVVALTRQSSASLREKLALTHSLIATPLHVSSARALGAEHIELVEFTPGREVTEAQTSIGDPKAGRSPWHNPARPTAATRRKPTNGQRRDVPFPDSCTATSTQ